jgi:hypothetical protein
MSCIDLAHADRRPVQRAAGPDRRFGGVGGSVHVPRRTVAPCDGAGMQLCRAHERAAPSRRGCERTGWLVPGLVLLRGLSLPGAASPGARAGIPGVGFVLAQAFEGVMT